MRVVHHHYSSGIDQWSDGVRERGREEEKKGKMVLEMKKMRN